VLIVESEEKPLYVDDIDDMDLEIVEEDRIENSELNVGTWLLAKYATKRTIKHVGEIQDKSEDGWLIKFTKFMNDKFI
jgi:hypothetical protein